MRPLIKIPLGFRPPQRRERIFSRAVGSRSRASAAGNPAVIEIFDEISRNYGFNATSFSSALRSAEGRPVTVRINSPGGDIFEGVAIYNLLANYSGGSRVEILGLAASAASLIAMAGGTVAIAANGHLMIHKSWAMVIGNENDCLEMAAVLGQLDESMAQTYSGRTGIDAETISQLMAAETWLNGEQAVENNFADELLHEQAAAAQYDLSVFQNVPAGIGMRGEDTLKVSSPNELESVLHQAGLSRRAAKRVVNGGWDALARNEQDDQSNEIKQLREIVTAATTKMKG